MSKKVKSYNTSPLIHVGFEAFAERIADASEVISSYEDDDIARIRALAHTGIHGYYNYLKSDQSLDDRTLIVNLLPFANGAVKRSREEREKGIESPQLSTHMAIRAEAIRLITGADVLTIPNDAGYANPQWFDVDEKRAIREGEVSPFADRINHIINSLEAYYTQIVVSGYSQGAVVSEKVAPLIPQVKKVVAIEPTNVRSWGRNRLTRLARIGFRYMTIGMKKVRAAAADSGIPRLQEAQEANPPLVPIIRNRYFRRMLTGNDFGDSSRDIPIDVYTNYDSTICEPPELWSRITSSRADGGKSPIEVHVLDGKHQDVIRSFGHVATDNVLLHGALLAKSLNRTN